MNIDKDQAQQRSIAANTAAHAGRVRLRGHIDDRAAPRVDAALGRQRRWLGTAAATDIAIAHEREAAAAVIEEARGIEARLEHGARQIASLDEDLEKSAAIVSARRVERAAALAVHTAGSTDPAEALRNRDRFDTLDSGLRALEAAHVRLLNTFNAAAAVTGESAAFMMRVARSEETLTRLAGAFTGAFGLSEGDVARMAESEPRANVALLALAAPAVIATITPPVRKTVTDRTPAEFAALVHLYIRLAAERGAR